MMSKLTWFVRLAFAVALAGGVSCDSGAPSAPPSEPIAKTTQAIDDLAPQRPSGSTLTVSNLAVTTLGSGAPLPPMGDEDDDDDCP